MSDLEVVAEAYSRDSRDSMQVTVMNIRQIGRILDGDKLVRQSDAERAVQLEMERHRKTWTQLEQAQRENAALKKLLDRANERMDDLKSGALSQQTETHPTQDGQPASGVTVEKDVFGTVHIKLGDFDYIQIRYQYPYTDNASQNVLAKRIVELLTRPAQTEQQPVARVAGNEIERYLRWEDGVAAFDLEIGAKLYTAPSCNHRFMYFGDQTKRRCADCYVVEGNEQPAPAQDERTAFEAWVMQHNTAVREDYDDTDENAPEDIRLDRQGGVYIWANAEAAWFAWKARSALDKRPAQTEQQPLFVPEGWLIELGFDVLDRPFRFVDGQSHSPTIKVILPPCEPDDSSSWSLRDEIARRIGSVLASPIAQTDPWQPSGADYDRAIHDNPDAKAWADLFVATFPGLKDKHGLMIGWFANAMMAMHDHLARKTTSQGLRVVFDGPPGPEAGRFVEIEDSDGCSVDAGEWRERTDGLWELVLHPAAPKPEQSGRLEAVKEAVEYLDANKLNQISSGSILHVKLSAALSAVTDEVDALIDGEAPAMAAKEPGAL